MSLELRRDSDRRLTEDIVSGKNVGNVVGLWMNLWLLGSLG